MEITAAALYNTPIRHRTLWFDGDSTYKADDIYTLVQQYPVSYVDRITPDIVDYNKHVTKADALTVKKEIRPLSFDWNLPPKAKALNVVDYVVDKHFREFGNLPDFNDREHRLVTELMAYRKMGLDDVLRAIIFVINRLSQHDVVWGVGRGSSVSSYVLYVIGVHDVDSFAYGLDIEDFLHE